MSIQTADGFVSFEASWRPEQYLADYYRGVQPDEKATLRFLLQAARRVGRVPTMLEFGCGPTIHHLLPFVAQVAEIHLADYMPGNLDAVADWVADAPGCHDWTPFVAFTLRDELGREPTVYELEQRVRLARRKITAALPADARYIRPLGDHAPIRRYPLVLCCFCPDSITADLDEWRRCLRNIVSLVERGGWLVYAALRGATGYRVGDARFPSAGVTEFDVADVLRSEGFERDELTIEVARVADDDDHGFSAVILAVGRRR